MTRPKDDAAVEVRPIGAGEETAVCELVCRVFDEHVAPEHGAEGRATFRAYAASPEALATRLAGGHLCLVAARGRVLVGAVEMRPPSHVALLFVETAFHRRGIARRLFEAALAAYCPEAREVTVNSSLHAVRAYERLGFRRIGSTVSRDGISYAPMVRLCPAG